MQWHPRRCGLAELETCTLSLSVTDKQDAVRTSSMCIQGDEKVQALLTLLTSDGRGGDQRNAYVRQTSMRVRRNDTTRKTKSTRSVQST